MELAVTPMEGAPASGPTVEVSAAAFDCKFNEPLVHQAVVAYLAGGRQGTKAQKSRGQVRGGGAKPWRQKGTGRARAGTIRSPLWRGGGVTFAAVPRNYKQKLNKKMYRAGLRSILSELIKQQRLQVVADFSVAEPRTAQVSARLRELELEAALIIVETLDEKLHLAARNLHRVEVIGVQQVNPVALVAAEKVVITVAAIKRLEEVLV